MSATAREVFVPTPRTRVKRLAYRARYERTTVEAILDEALLCHVGFSIEGRPVVLPTAYARIGAWLYLHGSRSNRMLRTLASGLDACVTVTLVDGLVLARSAFHHSMNYRSVVLFGRAEEVEDESERARSLEALVEHVVPGRYEHVRPPTREEYLHTLVIRFPIQEASAKVREGFPIDDEADYTLDVWAGVVPLRLEPQPYEEDPRLKLGTPLPDHVRSAGRRGAGR